MSDSSQRPKVTLEDLLRLKRAERPDAEFWGKFERELRQKQLTALLQKRPWWQELPQLLARRSYLPLGATAVLAFTLVSIKYYAPSQIAQEETKLNGSPAVAGDMAVPSPETFPVTSVSSPLLNRNDQAVSRLDDRTALAAMNVEMPSADQGIEVQMPQMVAPKEIQTPSARSIAANLARLEQSEPELINSVVGSRLSSPARVQTASLQVNDLASMPTSASKRSRLLAQYSDRQLAPEPTAPEIVRERLSRRLGDPDLYDRISRLGVRGDAVSLRF